MKIAQSAKRAALFIADLLSTVPLSSFLKKHGIKDKKYKARLVEKLRTQYSLQPAPRTGRPPVYTSQQLGEAQHLLISSPHPIHSTAALVGELKDQQVLPGEAKRRGFVPALQRQLAQQHLQLGYGTRSKGQALSADHKRQRLAWCKKMRKVLTSTALKDWHFADEKPHGVGGKSRCELHCAAAKHKRRCCIAVPRVAQLPLLSWVRHLAVRCMLAARMRIALHGS